MPIDPNALSAVVHPLTGAQIRDAIQDAHDMLPVVPNNTLTSTSITEPLAANQGKILDGRVEVLENRNDLNGLPDWAIGDTYEVDDIVKDNGQIFKSLQNPNQGNLTSDVAWWVVVNDVALISYNNVVNKDNVTGKVSPSTLELASRVGQVRPRYISNSQGIVKIARGKDFCLTTTVPENQVITFNYTLQYGVEYSIVIYNNTGATKTWSVDPAYFSGITELTALSGETCVYRFLSEQTKLAFLKKDIVGVTPTAGVAGVPLDFSTAGSGTQSFSDLTNLTEQYLWSDDSSGTVNDAVAIRIEDMNSVYRDILPVADQTEEDDIEANWDTFYAGKKVYRTDSNIYKTWNGNVFVEDAITTSDNSMRAGSGTSNIDEVQTFTFDVPFSGSDGTVDANIIVLLTSTQSDLQELLPVTTTALTGFTIDRNININGFSTFNYVAFNNNALPKSIIANGEIVVDRTGMVAGDTFEYDGTKMIKAQPENYTAAEADTGKRMPNGNIIYRQILAGTNLTSNQVLMTGVKHLINTSGYTRNAAGVEVPIPYNDGTNVVLIFRSSNSDVLVSFIGTLNDEYEIILEYTKV